MFQETIIEGLRPSLTKYDLVRTQQLPLKVSIFFWPSLGLSSGCTIIAAGGLALQYTQ